jgi:hypothetical protein
MARPKHKPSFSVRIDILEKQDCRCAYCNIPLNEVQIEWDHFLPYAYSKDNSRSNIVAACRACNQAKRARIFASEADLTDFCIEMVKSHGSRGNGLPEGITARFLAY